LSRVHTGAVATDYVETILRMPEMIEWMDAARLEPDDVEELEMEF
jgi:glutathione S-transferase